MTLVLPISNSADLKKRTSTSSDKEMNTRSLPKPNRIVLLRRRSFFPHPSALETKPTSPLSCRICEAHRARIRGECEQTKIGIEREGRRHLVGAAPVDAEAGERVHVLHRRIFFFPLSASASSSAPPVWRLRRRGFSWGFLLSELSVF
jgi:hypothetical protein